MAEHGAGGPVFALICGPNGSGKTSLIARMIQARYPEMQIVSADDLAQEMAPRNPRSAAQAAATSAVQACETAIGEKRSFAIELRPNGRLERDLIRKAQAAAFTIEAYLITAGSLELCAARVDARVKLGEHSVPLDEIRLNYRRFTEQAAAIVAAADLAMAHDNSGSGLEGSPVPVLGAAGGKIYHLGQPPPSWLKEAFDLVGAPLHLGADLGPWAENPKAYKAQRLLEARKARSPD